MRGSDRRRDPGAVPAAPDRGRRPGRACRGRAAGAARGAAAGLLRGRSALIGSGGATAGAGAPASRGLPGGGRPSGRVAGRHRQPPAIASDDSQNRPRPRQPANERRPGLPPANGRRSVGGDAILRRHRLRQHQRLLQLEVGFIRLGRVELREALGRLARNLLGDRRQVGARRRSASAGVPPWFLSTRLRSASRSGPKRGVSSRVSAPCTSGAMPRPWIERPDGV